MELNDEEKERKNERGAIKLAAGTIAVMVVTVIVVGMILVAYS